MSGSNFTGGGGGGKHPSSAVPGAKSPVLVGLKGLSFCERLLLQLRSESIHLHGGTYYFQDNCI